MNKSPPLPFAVFEGSLSVYRNHGLDLILRNLKANHIKVHFNIILPS